MKKKSEWIAELTNDIARLKGVNRKTLFLISAEMTNEIATAVVKHFKDVGYTVESKKCSSCKNSWDIIIQWT